MLFFLSYLLLFFCIELARCTVNQGWLNKKQEETKDIYTYFQKYQENKLVFCYSC